MTTARWAIVVVALAAAVWVGSATLDVSAWLLAPAAVPVLTVVALLSGRQRTLEGRASAACTAEQTLVGGGASAARNYRHGVTGSGGVGGGLA